MMYKEKILIYYFQNSTHILIAFCNALFKSTSEKTLDKLDI